MGEVICFIVQVRAGFKRYIDVFPINFGLKEGGICGWVCTIIANILQEVIQTSSCSWE
jgi:hypothetical protein